MIVFRMHRTGADAFDTMGSFLYAGRWHKVGTRVVYTAEHASLAVLETLIHAGGRKIPPRSLTRIQVPDEIEVEEARWMEMPDSQTWGDYWAREKRSAVLRAPSIAVNCIESSFILNPAHPDFAKIHHHEPEEFRFDPRFFPAGNL